MSITISSFSSILPDLLCTLWVISLARIFAGELSPELRLLEEKPVSFLGEGIGVGGVAVEGLPSCSVAVESEFNDTASCSLSVAAL